MSFKPNSFIIDSSAWIEYFNGTLKGKSARETIEKENFEIFTLDVCIAEIKFWALRENKDFIVLLTVIRSNSIVTETNLNDWLKAAEIKFEKRKTIKDFGIVDALILAKSKDLNNKILSTDAHFKHEKNACLL